jgi:hypothetical protein
MKSSQVTGYTVVLPPGWQRLPVRTDADKAIRAAVADALRAVPKNVPRDQLAPYRVELERRLRAMVASARKPGGLDLYLPVQPVHGVPIPASFVVSEGSLGAVDPVDPAQMVAYLATESVNGTAVTVDGSGAVRTEHTAGPEPTADLEVGSRRVDYMVPVPGEADRWLVVAFSTLGAGDPDDQIAAALVQLFDAIMSTFRWDRGGTG